MPARAQHSTTLKAITARQLQALVRQRLYHPSACDETRRAKLAAADRVVGTFCSLEGRGRIDPCRVESGLRDPVQIAAARNGRGIADPRVGPDPHEEASHDEECSSEEEALGGGCNGIRLR